MEYLMTYGWALLVIVVVVAVLAYILSSYSSIEQCTFQPGFSCAQPVLTNTKSGGVLYATITNSNQQAIIVDGLACISGTTPPAGDMSTWGAANALLKTPMTVDFQGTFNTGNMTPDALSDGTQPKNATTHCFDSTLSPLTLQAGSNFNGRIYIAYRFASDASYVPDKIISGNLATKVQ